MTKHAPVLLDESVRGLNLKPDSVVVDATVGGGGHAEAILRRLGPNGMLIGLDRDPVAVELARLRLDRVQKGNVNIHLANFSSIVEVLADLGIAAVDAVLMDLGVSSFQIDTPERGFSFQKRGPLDMRMGPSSLRSAADIVNSWSEADIAEILFSMGEERSARRVAKAIVAERRRAPIEDTERLADIIARSKGGRRGRVHPATKSFMALRMAVNDELESLSLGLEGALQVLKVGGRMAVISFHSIEDRVVKHFFREHAGRQISLQAGGERWEGALPPLKLTSRKPEVAGFEELERNPRSRSAKLRIAERCG